MTADPGGAGLAAMPPQLNAYMASRPRGARPSLPLLCQLCEAQFCSASAFREHLDRAHGGEQRYRDAWFSMVALRPHVVTGFEMRRVVENFALCYHRSMDVPELGGPPPRKPFAEQVLRL